MSDASVIRMKRTTSSRSLRLWVATSALALLLATTGCFPYPESMSVSVPTVTALGDDLPPKLSESWIAFAADGPAPDIRLVQPGEPAHRIIWSDDDGLTPSCPAFATGTARLAFGEAAGDYETGWTDAALVLADVNAAGEGFDRHTHGARRWNVLAVPDLVRRFVRWSDTVPYEAPQTWSASADSSVLMNVVSI
jgi:hypothetical protein